MTANVKVGQLRSGRTGRVEVIRAWGPSNDRFATTREPGRQNESTTTALDVARTHPVLLAEVGQQRRTPCGKLMVTISDFVPGYSGPWVIKKPWGGRAYLTADELLAEYPTVVEQSAGAQTP